MSGLRQYQQRALDDLRAAYADGHRAVCLVCPTGGGKTRIAATAIQSAVARGRRVLMLAHRRELIGQAANHLRAEGISDLRVIQAGGAHGKPDAPVTVASIQTLTAKRWRDRLPSANLVVFDEAHHTRAKSWESLADHYSRARLLGLTATPERSDGAPLGDVFQALVVASTVRELTELGHLVPCDVFAPAEQATALASDPVEAFLAYSDGRKGLVFCANVVHAEDVAARLNSAGVPTGCVDGTMQARDRAAVLARFASGELRCLSNVMCLTEGYDQPDAAVCVLARGCTHASLYLQIIGRVIRTAAGKTRATLVDLRGAVHSHGLPDEDRVYSLTGKAISTAEKLPALMRCKECLAMYRPAPQCPLCGTAKKMPTPPAVRRQILERISATHTADQRAAYRAQLAEKAREKGYHPNWVHHRMVARYGAA